MNNFKGFSLSLIKRFAIQILISLYYMREHNIVHCDLKPENILLGQDGHIKLADFGLAKKLEFKEIRSVPAQSQDNVNRNIKRA